MLQSKGETPDERFYLQNWYPLVHTYVAEFVRDLGLDDSRMENVAAAIEKGHAYVQQDFVVVVMIDISGYSKLTSILTELGKVSSEMITQTVGPYLNKIINMVSCFGDAVMVPFEPDQNLDESEY
ncbi:hypothetical protein HDU76_002730 [Blyttiomyces sp. JEL0837]|nr:hypothetical protein HDU76_002730 [Blyttiomyces sp. JEL0837]